MVNGKAQRRKKLCLTLHIFVEFIEAEKQNWDFTAWATALAIAFFSEKLSERKESWELVSVKANKSLLTINRCDGFSMSSNPSKSDRKLVGRNPDQKSTSFSHRKLDASKTHRKKTSFSHRYLESS